MRLWEGQCLGTSPSSFTAPRSPTLHLWPSKKLDTVQITVCVVYAVVSAHPPALPACPKRVTSECRWGRVASCLPRCLPLVPEGETGL